MDASYLKVRSKSLEGQSHIREPKIIGGIAVGSNKKIQNLIRSTPTSAGPDFTPQNIVVNEHGALHETRDNFGNAKMFTSGYM